MSVERPERDVRCTRCRSEFTDAEVSGASACPSCGTTGIPMRIADDVTIAVNWHELRILTIWASNWATAHCDRDSREALAAILHSLALQHPDKSPLTLAGDIAALRSQLDSEGIDVETNVRDLLDARGEEGRDA